MALHRGERDRHVDDEPDHGHARHDQHNGHERRADAEQQSGSQKHTAASVITRVAPSRVTKPRSPKADASDREDAAQPHVRRRGPRGRLSCACRNRPRGAPLSKVPTEEPMTVPGEPARRDTH